MENIDIVNAWLKISEADGIDTILCSSSCNGKKRYYATINVGMLFHFSNTDADVMKAIERTVNQYSNWVIENESNKK